MYRTLLLSFLTLMLCAACSTRRELQSADEDTPLRPQSAVIPTTSKVDEKTERRYREVFTEAMRRKQAEQADAACELLEEALRLKPNAAESLYELGMLKLAYTTFSDTLSKAEGDSLIRKATRLAPENLYYKEILARLQANATNFREAINLFEEIAEARPSSETLITLEWLYKNNGDYAGAIRTLERLEKIEGKNEELSVEKFNTFLAMQDTERAYRAIEELCAEYPTDLRYRVLLGDLYDRNGYHERALAIYKDVLTAEPNNSFAQISLLAYYKSAEADSLYFDLLTRVALNPHTQSSARNEVMNAYVVESLKQENGDTTRVMQLLRRTMAAQPTETYLVELTVFYMLKKEMPYERVIPYMQRILSIEPDNKRSRLALLEIYLNRQEMESVEDICREGLIYDPAEPVYYYYQGTALYFLGRNREAIASLQLGTERINPEEDQEVASNIWATLGDILHEQHLKEEAFTAYDHALRYNDRNTLCLNNYAYFLSLSGKRLEEAEKMSRLSIEIAPTDATYLDTYAWILYKLKQYSQAEIYINEALRHAEENETKASLYDHAGDIYYHCGKRKEALELWKKSLSLTTVRTEKTNLRRKIARRHP